MNKDDLLRDQAEMINKTRDILKTCQDDLRTDYSCFQFALRRIERAYDELLTLYKLTEV